MKIFLFMSYLRDNESVKDTDMLHAVDYSKLPLNQLVKMLASRKEKDAQLKKNMRSMTTTCMHFRLNECLRNSLYF